MKKKKNEKHYLTNTGVTVKHTVYMSAGNSNQHSYPLRQLPSRCFCIVSMSETLNFTSTGIYRVNSTL